MKKSIVILMGAMLLLTGCDFFRVLAGRPTGKEIENKRQEIAMARAAAEKAIADSIARVEQERKQAERDSIDAFSYIEANKVLVHPLGRVGGIAEDFLPAGEGGRYRAVLGSFREKANAEAMVRNIEAAGDFKPHLIHFQRGMYAVAACPSNAMGKTVAGFRKLKELPVCPADAWILKVE